MSQERISHFCKYRKLPVYSRVGAHSGDLIQLAHFGQAGLPACEIEIDNASLAVTCGYPEASTDECPTVQKERAAGNIR